MGVSIIVPAYNAEKFLAAAIQSVLAQSVADWELVVVNDGSTDQTGTIAEKFSRLDHRIRVVHQGNAGVSVARNRGFAEIREDSDYILFLDSDDLLEPDALEILLQSLDQDHDAVAAHGMLRYNDTDGQPLAIGGSHIWPERRRGFQGKMLKIWPVTAPTTFEVLAYANCVATPGLMMRRAPAEIVGGCDPNLKICEDWDMWLRLSRLGHIAFINRVVFSCRRHADNATNPQALKRASSIELSIRKKMYESADLNAQEKRLILLGYRYRELYAAKVRLSYAANKLSRGKLTDASKQLRVAMGHILSSLQRAEAIFG